MHRHPLAAIGTILLALFFLAPATTAPAREVNLGVITVKSKDQADRIRARLLKGESFEKLARKLSVGAAASRGGRLGLVPVKRLRPEYKEALKGLVPGKPSAIVPTEEGYTILMLFPGSAPAVGATPPAPAKPAAPQAIKEDRFRLARQKMMAGLEALVAGNQAEARRHFSQAVGYNPRQDSAPFFLDMVEELKAGKYSAKAVGTFAEGFLAMLQGEVKGALTLFSKAATQDPRLWQAKLFEANMLGEMGQKQQAAQLWHEVLKQNPRAALAHVSLGVLALEQKNVQEAKDQFHKALAIDPNLATAYYHLGSLALRQGDLKEAERQLKAAIAADPYLDQAYNDLGLVMAYSGRAEQAKKYYRKALDINPEYAAVHLNLGTLYARLKRYNQAIDEFNKALALMPAMAEAHNNLAAAYVLKKDWDKAIKHADLALKLHFPVPKNILEAIAPHRKKQ